MNTPSAGRNFKFGESQTQIKRNFQNLESKTDNINYSNKNANDPNGQPLISKRIADQSEGSTGIPGTRVSDLGK